MSLSVSVLMSVCKKRDNLELILEAFNRQTDTDLVLELNGCDEDNMRAGIGSDSDIEWRLLKLGIELRKVKHACLFYQLHTTSSIWNPRWRSTPP